MNITSKLATLALGSCLAMASGSALAELYGEVHVSQMGWRLVDLDANDGVTPAMDSFDWQAYHDSTLTEGPTAMWGETRVGGIAEPFSTHVGADFTSLDTAQNAEYLRGTARVNNPGSFSAYAMQWEYFTLTPHTRIEYFGTYSIRAMGDGREFAWGNSAESAIKSSVSAEVIEFRGDARTPENYFFKDVSVRGGVGANELTGNFTIRYDNLKDSEITGFYNLQITVAGDTPVVQVPEPETYAMMLGGLMMLAFVARRRNGKKST